MNGVCLQGNSILTAREKERAEPKVEVGEQCVVLVFNLCLKILSIIGKRLDILISSEFWEISFNKIMGMLWKLEIEIS